MFQSPSLKKNTTWPIVWDLVGPQLHLHPHHAHCKATSNWIWRLSFSWISFHLYYIHRSPKEVEHLNLHLLNFTYYIYSSTTFFSWCYLSIFPPYWYMYLCFVPFFADDYFFCLVSLVAASLGSDWKCRLGNQMIWVEILSAPLISARYFTTSWFIYKIEVIITPSPWWWGALGLRETTLA